MMIKLLNILFLPTLYFSISFGQYDYSLMDINPNSISYQENVGPSLSPNQVTLHYFGYYYWGICTSRFEQLNDLVNGLDNLGYDQLELVGIGKSIHESSLNNWTNGNTSSVCMDESPYDVWNDWSANQRDLFVIDYEGNLVLHQNISGGLPNDLQSIIIDLIAQIPGDEECIDGEISYDDPCNLMQCVDGVWLPYMVIDCEEQMGMPCEGGVYIPPAEGVCCSECVLTGDLNFDGIINVIDIVTMVNVIVSDGDLSPNVLLVADFNGDGIINVIDVVSLVNNIIS